MPISTPHFSHVEIASYALLANLHVLLEKPAGASSYNVLKLNEIAKEKNTLVFSMMFNLRENLLFAKAKQLIDDDRIGKIRRINWIDTWLYSPQGYFNNGAWRGTWDGEGGGVLLNQASHQLDTLQWLTGMPKTIYSKCKFGSYHDILVEDDVTAMMTYENGATGVFVASTHEWPGTNRLEISGGKGRLVVETNINKSDSGPPSTQTVLLDEYAISEQEFSQSTAGDSAWTEYDFNRRIFDFSDALNDKNIAKESRFKIILNFIACINGDEIPTAKGIDAINSLVLSNAMLLSTWTNEQIDLNDFDYKKFDKLLRKKRDESQ